MSYYIYIIIKSVILAFYFVISVIFLFALWEMLVPKQLKREYMIYEIPKSGYGYLLISWTNKNQNPIIKIKKDKILYSNLEHQKFIDETTKKVFFKVEEIGSYDVFIFGRDLGKINIEFYPCSKEEMENLNKNISNSMNNIQIDSVDYSEELKSIRKELENLNFYIEQNNLQKSNNATSKTILKNSYDKDNFTDKKLTQETVRQNKVEKPKPIEKPIYKEPVKQQVLEEQTPQEKVLNKQMNKTIEKFFGPESIEEKPKPVVKEKQFEQDPFYFYDDEDEYGEELITFKEPKNSYNESSHKTIKLNKNKN